MLVDLGPLGQQTVIATLLLAVGGSCLLWYSIEITRVLLSIFVLPGKSVRSSVLHRMLNSEKNFQLRTFGGPGTWAVVTGASDGIGREYARQLAQKGYNLVLASRTQSKLENLRDEILASSPNLKVDILSIDFSANKESDYTALSSLLKSKKISILMNNVGQSHNMPVEFQHTPVQELTNIIMINCLATLKITQLVLPHMLPQKRGLILTMGSFGGVLPTPLLATYSGSKAFLQQWSNALASELKPSGITVHFVHANIVTSSMSKVRRTSWSVPSESVFARSVLNKVGRRGGSIGFTYTGTPYWGHAVVGAPVTGLLGTYNKYLLEYNRQLHIGIQRRSLAKIERDKAKAEKSS